MDETEGGARSRGLRIGFVPGVTLTKWRRIWGERYPRTPLEVVEVAEDEQRAVLGDGRVDLCFARLPVDREGLHVIPLYEEQPVVVVPKDHPVAAFDTVTLADLAGEELLDADVPVDPIDLVAGGVGLAVVPQSVARSRSRRDLVHRPVTDAEPTTIGLCWLQDDDRPETEDFIGVVRGRTANSSRTTQSGGTPPSRAATRKAAPRQTARKEPAQKPARRRSSGRGPKRSR